MVFRAETVVHIDVNAHVSVPEAMQMTFGRLKYSREPKATAVPRGVPGKILIGGALSFDVPLLDAQVLSLYYRAID